jgi:flagellar motor switch protein FliM
MTMIETRLIHKITDRALEALGQAWENVKKLEFKLTESESNPQLVQIVPPNEVTVVIGFELKMGSRAGTMSLCLPYNVIEPLLEDLTKRSWSQVGRGAPAAPRSTRAASPAGSGKQRLT